MVPIYESEEAKKYLAASAGAAAAPDPAVERSVAAIVADVAARGDAALADLAERFGDPVRDSLILTDAEVDALAAEVPDPARAVLERAAENIGAFAQAVRDSLRTVDLDRGGFRVGLAYRPVKRAGCYVPAGRYPLPSTALMTAVTARAAGVTEVAMACPRPTAEVALAARLAGVDRLYQMGGAQAVAALALGTETVPAVDVIAGPGNAYVTEAKRQLQGRVGVDMIAGPSEVAVVADQGANPAWVAADMLAQMEHDPDARAWLFTNDRALAEAVQAELEARLAGPGLPDFVSPAMAAILLLESLDACCRASDAVAPEHLLLAVHDGEGAAAKVRDYGALFVGYAATVPFGDYLAGPNHTLPTGRTARFSGGLTPLAFLRPQSWLSVQDGGASLAEDTAVFAELEGLAMHAEAARLRVRGA